MIPFKECVYRENRRWEGRDFLQSRNQPILSPRQEYQIPTRLPHHTYTAITFFLKLNTKFL